MPPNSSDMCIFSLFCGSDQSDCLLWMFAVSFVWGVSAALHLQLRVANKMAKYCCRQFCHQVWIEAACERPWKATLLKQTTGRQGLLQADFASVPSLSEKEKERIPVCYFLCVWNKMKLGSFAFLCVQTGLQWKGIIIKVRFVVVILQVFYFKWLPPEHIKVERPHLIARSMEVNKSVACKRLIKGRQLLFQVFWNGKKIWIRDCRFCSQLCCWGTCGFQQIFISKRIFP